MPINLNSASSSFKAIFALDVLTAAIALIFLGLATRPTFTRIAKRRFTTTGRGIGSPLKTTLGTYLFLWPALGFFFLTYTFRFVQVILQTGGDINYNDSLQLHGRPSGNSTGYNESIVALSLAQALASIFFATLINGGIWIYSNHVTTNATGSPGPNVKSKVWNTLIMLAILGTGLAAFGEAIATGGGGGLTWSQAIYRTTVTRALYATHRAVVVAASISVSVEMWHDYSFVKKHSYMKTSERPHLARFALVVIPLIWIRNALIVYDIALVYINSAGWTRTTSLASTFLLIIFGRFANLTILGMILWGAWRTGRTVALTGADK